MTWNTNTAILARLETFSDEAAWTSLVEHFQPLLVRYARRVGLSPNAVEDVAQETLVAFAMAYRSGRYDRAEGRLSAWIFGIARREVASQRRRAALEPARALGTKEERDLCVEHEGEPGNVWEEEWRRSVTERCIERARRELEPATWECFEMQTFQGLSAKEVGTRMGLSLAQVYDAKYRVTRRLRKLERAHEDA